MKPEVESLLREIIGLLEQQLEIQKKIFETKGDKIEISQTEFYPKLLSETKKVLKELKEIKNLLTPV